MCPIRICQKKMHAASLARHMRLVHKLSREECTNATSRHGIRKEYKWRTERATPKAKDKHLHRQCPFYGCLAVVKRMGPHLRSKAHGIAPTDPRYRDLCKSAVVYEGGSIRAQAAKKRKLERAAIVADNRKKLTNSSQTNTRAQSH